MVAILRKSEMAAKAKSSHDSILTERSRRHRTQIIAWQQLVMNAPLQWSLVAASGDVKAGSVRIENTGVSDTNEPLGLEIRWSDLKSEQTAEQLDKRIKPLLDNAKSLAKRAKFGDAEINVSSYADKRHPDRPVVREFYWSSEGSGLGRIWRCKTCGRLMILQVYGQARAKYSFRAKEIMASVECHNFDRDWSRWALYGLDTTIPSDYHLAGQQIMNIYLELRFTKLGHKYGDALTIEQWSAANVQLKGQYLDEFVERKANALQRSVQFEKAETLVNGHPSLVLSGLRSGIGYWVGDAIKQLSAFQKPASEYSGVAWECPDANKIYMVHTLTRAKDCKLPELVASKTQCHPLKAET